MTNPFTAEGAEEKERESALCVNILNRIGSEDR